MLETDCFPAYGSAPRTLVIALTSVGEAPGTINHVLHYGSPHIREAYGVTSRGFSKNAWGGQTACEGSDSRSRQQANRKRSFMGR